MLFNKVIQNKNTETASFYYKLAEHKEDCMKPLKLTNNTKLVPQVNKASSEKSNYYLPYFTDIVAIELRESEFDIEIKAHDPAFIEHKIVKITQDLFPDVIALLSGKISCFDFLKLYFGFIINKHNLPFDSALPPIQNIERVHARTGLLISTSVLNYVKVFNHMLENDIKEPLVDLMLWLPKLTHAAQDYDISFSAYKCLDDEVISAIDNDLYADLRPNSLTNLSLRFFKNSIRKLDSKDEGEIKQRLKKNLPIELFTPVDSAEEIQPFVRFGKSRSQ